MSRGTGIDLGKGYVRLAELDCRKGSVVMRRYQSAELETGESPQQAASEVFGKCSGARIGVTGSDVMLRYLPVPEVEDWRLERLMEFEVRELESRSGSPLATSYNLLPVPKELDVEDTMLLGVIREDLLDDWVAQLAPISAEGFTPNAIALYNAYLALGDHEASVTLLANLGKSTLDLALVRGTELYFARSVSTSLDQRDTALAKNLGIQATRAQELIHKHLDLRLGLGERLSSDADRVTRPVLPLYDSLPTLLSGMITLCRAQARLRELTLNRVLLTGGGAKANGLAEFLTARMRLPVSLWDPTQMVDPGRLSAEELADLDEDGPAAAVSLGLALSSADPELYALEILSEDSRKKRDFKERGIWSVLAGVAALAFLGFNYSVTSAQAEVTADVAKRLARQVKAAESSHSKALGLLDEVLFQQKLVKELSSRHAIRRSAQEMLSFLHASLPADLWVDSLQVELQDGDQWGNEKRLVPVLSIQGKGQDGARSASSVFGDFQETLKRELPQGESMVKATTTNRAQDLHWKLEACLLKLPIAQEDEE